MEIASFLVFLVLSHFLVLQIFRLTTYHRFFWKALPLLLLYSATAAWIFYKLITPSFFLWQVVLAAVWLIVIWRKQKSQAQVMVETAAIIPSDQTALSTSLSKTVAYFAFSIVVYVVTFAITYVWIFNRYFSEAAIRPISQ